MLNNQCRVTVFWLGPATDGDLGPADSVQWICKEWVQKLGQRLVWKLGMIMQELRTEPDGPMLRGKGLLIPEYEFPPHLTSQAPPPPSLWEISDIIYPFLWFILFIHLLVIHAHTWVHVPSATPSDALWAVVAPITLSRGHVHINGVRTLAVGI